MKYVKLKTDNLIWATCISGAIVSAHKNVVNPPINFVIESDSPEIQFLGSVFDQTKPGVNYEEIQPPTKEEELEILDVFGAKKLERELRVLHGVDIEEAVSKLTLLDLGNLILEKHGIKGQPKTFYPKMSKPQYQSYIEYDCVIMNKKYLPWAKEYAKGYGTNFNILDATQLPTIEVVKALNNPNLKLLVAHASDPILFVAKSYYKDYDSISQTFATLVLYEPSFQFDRFCCPLWGACLPQNIEDPAAEYKGKLRKLQEICKFDNHEYKKRKTKGLLPEALMV